MLACSGLVEANLVPDTPIADDRAFDREPPGDSHRACTNRRRHLPTVGCATRSRAATSVFDRPSAQPSTIRDRTASACELFRRRAHRVSISRSSPVNTSSAFGRPRDAIRESSYPPTRFAAQHRRCPSITIM